MPKQLTHFNTKNLNKKFPIILLCDGIKSPSNIGSLFRLSDALGVSEIVFCDSNLNLKSSRLQKTARSTQKRVSHRIGTEIVSEIERFKNDEFQIIALEITDTSVSVANFLATKNQKIVLVIGNEQQGISNKVLQISDAIIKIDMFGNNSSMNVVQATSIALYTLVNKTYI